MSSRWIYIVAAATLASVPMPALACSVCFGDPNSATAQGVVMGVLALLGVVLCVLGGFAAFAIYLARRASSSAAESIPTPDAAKQV